jgi:hypothetical protein
MKLTNRQQELARAPQKSFGTILAFLIIAVNWKFGRPRKGEEKQTETSNVKHRAEGFVVITRGAKKHQWEYRTPFSQQPQTS